LAPGIGLEPTTP